MAMKVISAVCTERQLFALLSRGIDLIAVIPESTQERKEWHYGIDTPDVFHDVVSWRVFYRVAQDCAAEDL